MLGNGQWFLCEMKSAVDAEKMWTMRYTWILWQQSLLCAFDDGFGGTYNDIYEKARLYDVKQTIMGLMVNQRDERQDYMMYVRCVTLFAFVSKRNQYPTGLVV